jgi:radical SAM superfamily enzyme YgiQ (UPF0313 family)
MKTNSSSSIDLIQPRHIYAPKTGLGHIWMPTSLLTIASMLIEAKVNVKLFDENIKEYNGDSNNIGFNVFGVPYVAPIQNKVKKFIKMEREIFIGGQTVKEISKIDFKKMFPGAINGTNQRQLVHKLGIKQIPNENQVSLIPAYELIPDWQFRLYLEHNFSFYVANGCACNCSFCPADKGRCEVYRSMEPIYKDLTYLFKRAKKLGVENIKFYITNLDVFQTASLLKQFAETVIKVRNENPSISLEFTGLARVHTFLLCVKHYPEVVELLVKAGYTTTGFGVDGYGKDVWRKIGKAGVWGYAEDEGAKSVLAAKLSKEFGIKPETLMVFGHPGVDTDDSLRKAYEFTLFLYEEYGAVPRPHVAKNMVPRTDHWNNPVNFQQKKVFMENPWLFQLLDFCCFATEFTHGTKEFANITNKYFQKICDIPGNETLPVFPIIPEIKNGNIFISENAIADMLSKNKGNYDH